MVTNRRSVLLLSKISLALALALGLTWRPVGFSTTARAYEAAAITQTSLDSGALALGQAINRLSVVASVLHTGAHPDDEDSGLLAYLARGRQARTAYLSLTRGDGGQNLIGPELFESLGVIRTDEMMAARRIDGAQQFFSRAFDFGFSKSRDEALAKWDREAVLADMVRVIRTFRPNVIVSAWSGTPSDGHGHHQAAGLLTMEAYRAAADASRFPEHVAAGLAPWKAQKLFIRAANRRQNEAQAREAERDILLINTGEFDPLFGRSYYEIAMRGRSMHRSQDQGALERRGPQYSRLKLIESSVPAAAEMKDIFEGLDTSLTSIADLAGRDLPELKRALSDAQRLADEAKQKYHPYRPSEVSGIIASGLEKLRAARAALPASGLSGATAYEIEFLLKQKERDFADALVKSQSVVVDCLSDDEVVVPGQSFNVTVSVYADPGVKLEQVSLSLQEGWTAERQKQDHSAQSGRLVSEAHFKVTVAQDAEPTQPYWLKGGRRGDMFVPGKGGTGIEPLSPPAVVATVSLEASGQKLTLDQPAQFRYADKALGEIRHEVKVAPIVSVSVAPDLVILPLASRPLEREVTVSVVNNAKQGAAGAVSLEGPPAWNISSEQTGFNLKREGESASFVFKIKAPPSSAEAQRELTAIAKVGASEFRRGYSVISYPHTEPRFVYRSALARASEIDVKVAPGLKVGYIEGAGDDFAAALKRLDVDVTVIEPRELATGDLSRYDVIVTGIRVYEVRPDVAANNGRLLEYVNQGGTLIVQYNKSEIIAGGFTPYPVKMERTPDRVTDERAEVTLLDPMHPVFNFPNKISERDFSGWVQERGTYFLSEWDPKFKPLMASNDAGEQPKRGGQIIAEYGRGLYVYTGYAWFRQLPAGVPGAYRLIANLVSLPKAKAAQGKAAR